MKKDSINTIKTIGKKQTSRLETLLFMVNDVEGLVDTLDKSFSEWSDFDSWENIGVQQWIFERAMDVYHGKKIDIKCDCCESIDLIQSESNNILMQKCYGFKSAYMIKKVLDEILLAEVRRKNDGTYSV